MHRQLDLLAPQRIGFDASFAELRRAELAGGAWVDHVPGWVTGHDRLFEELERSLTWRTETRRMYERKIATPRLLATIAATEDDETTRCFAIFHEDTTRCSSSCLP